MLAYYTKQIEATITSHPLFSILIDLSSVFKAQDDACLEYTLQQAIRTTMRAELLTPHHPDPRLFYAHQHFLHQSHFTLRRAASQRCDLVKQCLAKPNELYTVIQCIRS